MSKTSTFECTYILWTETDNSYEIKTINRPRPTPSELGDEWHISNYVAFQIEKQLRNGGMTLDEIQKLYKAIY